MYSEAGESLFPKTKHNRIKYEISLFEVGSIMVYYKILLGNYLPGFNTFTFEFVVIDERGLEDKAFFV